MNQGIYKLVYSRVLHMMVPVSEAAKGHVSKGGRRIRKHAKQALQYSVMLSFTMIGNVWAETVLPAGVVIRDIVNNSATLVNSTANSVTFRNNANAAIVNFNQLNIQRGESFNVLMNANQSFLGRIHDINPSSLNGAFNAAGNLYFINSNGIIIGKDATFNVGTLYAGTLGITDELFQSGFVNDQTFTKAFEWVGVLDIDDAARTRAANAEVLVQGGAQITTANNGKVMLFAPNVKVEKEGVVTDINGVVQKDANGNVIMRETLIRTPEGQTILAAGKKIYLKGAADPAGFLVEVDAGGTAVNLGKIVAERGNITMMGLAVNQGGTLSATTSVRANGSIKLIAQDTASESAPGVVIGSRNGAVTLAKGSVTEVKPDYEDKEETIVSQPFKTSDVTIEASLINIDGKVSVKGGNVTAKSEFDASSQLKFDAQGNVDLSLDPADAFAGQNTRRIYLGENASIDVSGVDAIAPMSRNQLEIQLFSDQLKDNPILRDSGLFRQTIFVDARKGTDLLDIQPFLDLVGATVAEKMTNAGTVTLSTNQDIIINKGAVIDVSGGSTTYTAGTIKESTLLFNGKLVPISEAKPGVAYTQVADSKKITDEKWGSVKTFELGGTTQSVNTYFEGANAGTVNLTTNVEAQNTQNLVLAGQLIANTKVSREQLLKQEAPAHGKLIASANKLTIDKTAKSLPTDFNFNEALPDSANYESVINSDFLANGFNNIDLTKVTELNINTQLNVKPHGNLIFGNGGADTFTNINASIYAPSTNILLQSLRTSVADNVTISTAGIFTNDRAGIVGALTREVAADGGSISAGLLSLGKNITLDASAGAWVDNKGELHTTGQAGDISFKANQNIDSSNRFQSYGFEQGGRLSINFINVSEQGAELAASLNIANNLAGDFSVNNSFFSQGGFSEYALSAFDVNIGQQNGAAQQVYGQAQNWRMNAGFLNKTGGQAMSAMARPVTLADYEKTAVSFDFTANRVGGDLGTLSLAENTTIRTDRGGNVSLTAGKQVNVLGDITTPSGNININVNDTDLDLPVDQTQAVFIGENAYLSAAGTSVVLPGSQPKLLKTQIFDAGTIKINERENASELLKAATIIKEGAVLDVSGASVVRDTDTINGFVTETLHGDAGTISISGTGALLVDGSFKAAATGTGRNGTLNLTYNARLGSDISPVVNGTETVVLTNDKQLSAADFNKGDAVKDGISTAFVKAQLSAEQIEQGGFANVHVKSFLNQPSANDRIELANGFDLNISGNLTLETPILHVQNNGVANIAAGHLTFKSPTLFLNPSSLVAGNGQLRTQSKQVYVNGLIGVSGTQQLTINTDLDIHGQGPRSFVQNGLLATDAGLTANGEITLNARQIYPDSGAKLKFEAIGANSKITVNSNGKGAKPVLSAGGELTLKAADIVQNGVLTAPFGRINLIGSDSVTLASGSITSVSGSGQNIPFGTTTTGGEVYNPANGATRPLVEKTVDIESADVDLQQGAVIDLSAGGDMFAYEWVPGLGGSQDILAQPNTYAVIPTMKGEYAPTDLAYAGSSAGVGVGQSVYLTGVPGLASGNYTLLPARYALVPGAYVVQMQATPAVVGNVTKQQDGSTLTTGYLADLTTGARDANWSTFRVLDGAVFRPAEGATSKAPSQYILTSANTFFNNPLKTEGMVVSTPSDVAKLSLSANQLALNANVIANTVADGTGLEVDISSNKIRVVNSQDDSNDGSLQLTVASLNALNAESVLLGGKRSLIDGVSNVTTVAESVTVENDNTQVLRTTEFIATANQQVTVKQGATIDTGTASTKPGAKTLQSNGEGALLALSSKNNITYSRAGGSVISTRGELIVESGASLKAGNSAVLDATSNVNLEGDVALSDGASVTLGANRILIGDAPQNVAGLNVNAESLAALGQLKSLALNSYSNIDTFGKVEFGNTGLDLTLNAAGIVGHLGASEVDVPNDNTASVITANTLTLKNNQDAVLINVADNSGRALNINAKTVRFEGEAAPVTTNGVLLATDQATVQGYSQLNINAGEVRTAATGQINLNVAQVNINAGRITSETGGKFTIIASDALNTTQNATATLTPNTQFGGQLTIEANNLNIASKVESLSGQVNLKSNTDLTLATGANVSTNSQSIDYYTTKQHLDAGKVTLSSTTGNVNVNTGAVVSATSTGNAKAGTVKVAATQGTLNLDGSLNGSATGTGLGGNLDVDVGSLNNLSATNQAATGFTESRSYRVRTGDVAITGTGEQALTARDISVAADTGSITVSGDVIATAPKNSSVGLYANQNLTLASTANIQANSTKAGEEGGRVELFTQQGTLDLQNGSSINVAGGTNGAGGDVHLRAPRTGAGAGDGVAVRALASAINGAKSTVLEAFKIFSGVITLTAGSGTGATLGFNTVAADVSDFMGNKDNIVASLGKTGDDTFHLRAGTEIQSSSNLTVGSDWNLYSEMRTGNEPGVLTLRAAENLNINGSISDGFTTALTTGQIGSGDSWAYRLVAGADFNSASPLGTIASAKALDGSAVTGNVSLAANKLIRTGTGDIEIATGGDLNMGNASSAIYTAGKQAPTLDDFTAPAAGNPLYLTQGGNIRVLTQGNIVGAEPLTGRQLINQWLFRQGGGSNNLDTTWWVRPDLFRQSLATMGGGDIELRAGGDISNFSASAPTTARYDISGKDVARVNENGEAVLDVNGNPIIDKVFASRIDGGGDVNVVAGNNINSGVYFVAKGDGNILAGGAIKPQDGTFGTVLALQDGSWNVNAADSITIDAVINPTWISQSTTNATLLDATGRNSYFNTFSPTASVNVASTTGDVALGMQSTVLTRTTGLDNSIANSLLYTPANINIAAYDGNANIGDITLTPAATGNLNVFAADDIGLGNVAMSDADPSRLPSVNAPVSRIRGFTNVVFNQLLTHSQDLLHGNDLQPALIVAKEGDVFANTANAIVSIPKVTKIVAGGDITNLNIALQNNRASDTSVIKAGRDVNTQNITIAGPGELLVQAGRNVDLIYPNVTTINSTGNSGSTNPIFGNTFASRANTALSSEGASITLQAGLGQGAAVQAFINQYVLPTGAGPATLADDAERLAAYRKATAQSVTDFMRKRTGDNTLTEQDALTQFAALDLEAKTVFANRHLTSELIGSGLDSVKAGNHARGDAAIASLFPTFNNGDILLFNSKVSTNSGGSIDMIAPGGLINVGVPGRGGDIGIITEKGGAIRAVADGDFQVNQSKVITQFGSDIAIWSTNGTIDAGRGSKTATSVPERIVQTDAFGNTIIEVRGVAAGSGIRAQSYDPDGPNGPQVEPKKGTVYLTAPTIDAGEAGIEAGDFFGFTDRFLNVGNLNIQGSSTGVPVAATAGIAGVGAGLSPDAVNSATQSVVQSVAQSANNSFVKPTLPSIISVDVISIGN